MKVTKQLALTVLALCASSQPCSAGLYDWITKENVSAALLGGALLEILIGRNIQLRWQRSAQPVCEDYRDSEVDQEIVNGLEVIDKVDTGINAIEKENPNLAVVRYMLENGLEVNTQNAVGNTLLHAACRAYNTDALALLLQPEGGNAFIQNNDHLTPLDVCAQNYKVDYQGIGEKAMQIVANLLSKTNDPLPNTTRALKAFGEVPNDALATELLYQLQANTEFFKQLFEPRNQLTFVGKATEIKNIFRDHKKKPREGDSINYKKTFAYQGHREIIHFVRALWQQEIGYIEIDKNHSGYQYFKGLLANEQGVEDLDNQPQADAQADSWWAVWDGVYSTVASYLTYASDAAWETLNEYGISKDNIKDAVIKLAVLAAKKIPLPGADQVIAKAIEYYRKQSGQINLGRTIIISHPKPGKILIMVPETKEGPQDK